MSNFSEIEKLVVQWGIDRGLQTGDVPNQQLKKFWEEVGELITGICKNDIFEIADAIGDIIVVLTHIAAFYNTTIEGCYKLAYNQIKDRKGKLINGVFVKES